jgi:hypothetical protein
MRFYTKQHKMYCAIDLHACTMYVSALSQVCQGIGGETPRHRGHAEQLSALRTRLPAVPSRLSPYAQVVLMSCRYTMTEAQERRAEKIVGW